MKSLKLNGFLGEMPDWIGSLMHLVKIYLKGSKLMGGKSKTMELLGTLPNLKLLVFRKNAYVGGKLVFGEGAFQNLRKLDFRGCSEVKEVIFEEGTSPHMEKIQFSHCRLPLGIIGVKHLPKLTEISLGSYGQVARLGALQGDLDAHPNHPVMRLLEDWSHHDLGDSWRIVVQVEEATEGEESSLHLDPAAAGESSSSQVVVVTTGSDSEDDLR